LRPATYEQVPVRTPQLCAEKGHRHIQVAMKLQMGQVDAGLLYL